MLLNIQIPPAWEKTVKTILAAAIGGAVTAIGDVLIATVDFQHNAIHLNQIDYHQVGMIGIAGAITAVKYLYTPHPATPTVTSVSEVK